MEDKIVNVINEMADVLNIAQLRKLQEVMLKHLSENSASKESTDNGEYLRLFLEAKHIEGCSDRTIAYYRATIEHFFVTVTEPVRKITTEIIRTYLVEYQKRNNCSKVTVDNVRRIISSFFSWLEE